MNLNAIRVRLVWALLALFGAAAAAGVWRKEYLDVIANATILCFSCIGIK